MTSTDQGYWTSDKPRPPERPEQPPELRSDAKELTAKGGHHRLAIVLLVVAGLLVVALAGGYWWVQRKIHPPGDPGEVVSIEVPEGSSTGDIAALLDAEGVVSDGTIFRWYARFEGASGWQAGVYELRLDSDMDEVIRALDAGPAGAPFDEVTVPEGLSVWAAAGDRSPGPVVQRLADDEAGVARFEPQTLVDLLVSGTIRSRYQPEGSQDLEGLLFPDTYRVEEEDTEEAVLTRMVQRFDDVAAEVGYDGATATVAAATQNQVQITPYQAIIVASLIERETLIASERPMVARVIYNRMAQGMTLGIDASTQYAIGRPIETQSDFDPASPYNLRAHQGLPPTPIGVPGRAALDAALHPAEGPWLYYVLSDQEGNHFFTDSEAEFFEAKEECARLGLGCG